MKILITGGGGFIGSYIAEYYAKKDTSSQIHVIDNLSRAKLLNNSKFINFDYNWHYLKKYKNIHFFKEDIQNLGFLKRLMKKNGYDVICHTAGQTAVTSSLSNPYLDFENNAIASVNLLESVRLSDSNPKLILCSTNKVYGDNVNKIELKENDFRYDIKNKNFEGISEEFDLDLCHHTPYGISKLSSDLYFQEYGHSYGLDTNIFRMSCIFGPRQMATENQGWLVFFIICALKGLKIKINGNGKQVRDILYISDLINAIHSLIEKNIKNEVFCIGGGSANSISILELINYLQEILVGEIKYNFENWRSADQLLYISDISKAQKILNWDPKINFKEGIKKTVDWCRENVKLFK
ncbi:MAG: GDP-mannose 4,6-dehydratase [Candidatus Lokiarchaeota archaeon]|nr:GDP-mannose 4,6-dehydratase [Candidatus Lokiarchaeota archaeon]